MTECERLISEGFLPPEFFKEEIICDYLVTETQKKVWAIDLDLLVQFRKVCEKHNLRWFMFIGSLLGCIRHQGFVPWDDDVDVAMPREDFDKLVELRDEFQGPYFLQTHLTDPGYAYTVGRLCNVRTTCIDRKFRMGSWHMGISLDIGIFEPWDSHVKEDDPRVQRIRKLCLDLGTVMRKDTPDLGPEDQKRVDELESDDIIGMHEEIRALEISCAGERPDSWQMVAQPALNAWKNNFVDEEFFPIKKKMFQGIEVNVPNDYLSLLSKNFGFLGFIRREQRGMWHGAFGFNPDRPFNELTPEEREHLWDEKEEEVIRAKNGAGRRTFSKLCAGDGNDYNDGEVYDKTPPQFGTDEYKAYLLKCKQSADIPSDWNRYIRKNDGSYKKIVLYSISAGVILRDGEKMLNKIRSNFDVFSENSENVALLWRPEPRIIETLRLMDEELAAGYEDLVAWYKDNHIGIYDDTEDVDRAVMVADAFYGDESSITQMCVDKGIPAMIQNADVI